MYVPVGSARLWSCASGQGRPIVFVNGGPGCDDYLAPVAELIDERCRVIRFEPRGCGRSDWDGRYDLDTLLEDMDAVRTTYGYDSWLLLGHSHGPNVALAYALRYPERALGVVGIAGGKIVDDRQWSQVYHERLASVGESTGGILFHADPEVNRQGNATWREYCRRPTLLRDLAHMPQRCAFITAGEDIRLNWPTEQLAALIPHARYSEIAGAAHMPWLTHASELRHELHMALDFIERGDGKQQ